MIERTQERFGLWPAKLAADSAYGSAENLAWLVHERGIEPHIPVSGCRRGNPSRRRHPPMRDARRWMSELVDGTAASTNAIALREQMGERNIRKLLPLACLSPAVIRAMADGSAPADLTIRQLTSALPHDWAQQEQKLLID